jgi:hypothetical protein
MAAGGPAIAWDRLVAAATAGWNRHRFAPTGRRPGPARFRRFLIVRISGKGGTSFNRGRKAFPEKRLSVSVKSLNRRFEVARIVLSVHQEVQMNHKFLVPALSILFLGGFAAVAQDKPVEKTVEKTTTSASGTTKSKDHSVVGTVKSYEAGKKIKVLVGKKTHSFTLNSKSVGTTVDPSVAVGSKVKVVQSTDANGIKTLTINPTS